MSNPMPDDEAMVTTYLRSQISNPTVLVDAAWPVAYDGSQTFVLVERVGGPMAAQGRQTWMDVPRIQVSTGAPNKAVAKDLANLVRSVMPLMYAAYTTTPVVANVEELVGPLWLPDPKYGPAGRYLSQYQLRIHN